MKSGTLTQVMSLESVTFEAEVTTLQRRGWKGRERARVSDEC